MRRAAKILVAGSRHISRLSKDVLKRLDKIVEQHFTIIIGDANGVDKAVQQYLSRTHYESVVVFCMEGVCRNNVGGWPMRAIAAPEPSRRDFSYYSIKDQLMVEEADYGLMIWDGKSRGTLRSIVDLVDRSKPAIVYVVPEKCFHSLRNREDLTKMLGGYDRASSILDQRPTVQTRKSHHHNDARRLFVEQ